MATITPRLFPMNLPLLHKLFLGLALSFLLAVSTLAETANTPAAELWREGAQVGTWPVIQQAIDHAEPGDLIRIRGGVYHENLTLHDLRADPETPFILEGAEGEQVIIDGADPRLQTPGSGLWQWDEQENGWVAQVPWRGQESRSILTWASHANDRLIAAHRDQEFFLAGNRGDALWRTGDTVRLRLADGGDPNDLALNIGMAEGIIQLRDSSGWIIRNLELRHAGFAGVHLDGPGVHDIHLEGLTIITAYRGISTENYSVGFSERIHITGCTIMNHWDFDWEWRQGYRDHLSSGNDESAPMRGTGINFKVIDGSVSHCEIAGQWDGMDVQGSNVRIHNNLFYNIKDDMMELESNNSTNIYVYDNIGFRVFVGISCVANRGGPIYIYRNQIRADLHSRMFDDTWRYGYPLKFGNDWGPGAENIFIYHNTFDSLGRSLFVARRSNPERWQNIEWVNNIFSRTTEGALGLEGMGTPERGIHWEDNLFVRQAELDRLTEYSEEFINAGFIGDPGLTNQEAYPPDFRLTSHSEAREAGSLRPSEMAWPDTLPAPESAFPDIGAIPYGSEIPDSALNRKLSWRWDDYVPTTTASKSTDSTYINSIEMASPGTPR